MVTEAILNDIALLRKMTKVAQKEHAYIMTLKVARLPRFRSRCRMCKAKADINSKSRGFTLHHIRYNDYDYTHNSFKEGHKDFIFDVNNKSVYEGVDLRALYKLEAVRQAYRDPSQFRFLCSKHHQAVEILDKFSPKLARALISVWRETRTRWPDK